MDRDTLINVGVVILIAGIIGSLFVIYPNYSVWQRELAGKAMLREAEWSKKISIEEAKALKESAELKAEAEIIRAKGVAEANQIIGDSLKGNEAYLRYLWIDGMKADQNQVIYVPTEAGIPILEAGRR